MGTRCNRDAIGAWVTVKLGGRTLARQIMPTRSYLSQSELPVTIGLGNADRADEITILWPDGTRQKLESARIDGLTVVEQPK